MLWMHGFKFTYSMSFASPGDEVAWAPTLPTMTQLLNQFLAPVLLFKLVHWVKHITNPRTQHAEPESEVTSLEVLNPEAILEEKHSKMTIS